MKADFLTTHHKWDLNDQLLTFENDNLQACYVIIKPEKGIGFGEERGEWITTLWNKISKSTNVINGHRISWDNLIFISNTTNTTTFKNHLIDILKTTLEPNLKSLALFSSLTGTAEEKIKEISMMELQLIKINYWKIHKYPEYFENGIQRMLPIS